MNRLFPSWLWRYRGCFIPPLAVSAAFILFAFLALLLGKQDLPKLTFTAVDGFPAFMDIKDTFAVAKVALWWILAIYLLWLAAIIGSLTALIITYSTIKDVSAKARRFGFVAMAAITGLIVIILGILATREAPSYAGQDLFFHVMELASGFGTLTQLSNEVTIIALVLIILCAGIIMMPEPGKIMYFKTVVLRRMDSLNTLLLIGAIVTVVWVFYARILYGFAASTLAECEQKSVASVAPTISLVTGGIASIYLIIMYFSGYLWLQSQYTTAPDAAQDKPTTAKDSAGAASKAKQEGKEKHQDKDKETKKSPESNLFRTWSRIFMFITPMLPGLFEIFLNLFEKV